ncbi:pilus assembly protein PilM [Streptococcus oricebi]|uniref:Fimbrial assembly protein n=1 Tax=Streptococcus oricebi TaxID=1547447 RepID=A0ABS5B641_9STRE|nr:pilus assembly protein PilM [Streptococcus oricebi]MBP2624186.1 fimbrial assembly protein [Streptococcus oricebi]
MGKSMFSSKRGKDSVEGEEKVKKESFLGKLNKPLFSKDKKDQDDFYLEEEEVEQVEEKKTSFLDKLNQPLLSKDKGAAKKKVKKAVPSQPYTMFGKPIKGNLMAIDLADDSVRVAVAKQRRLDLEIVLTVSAPLPPGVVQAGQILDPMTLKDVLLQLMDDYTINAKYAFFSINNSNIIARMVPVSAAVAEEDLEGLLSYELQQYLDIDPTAYAIQYEDMGQIMALGADENERNLRVYAVPRGLIEQYLNLANELKLVPYAFDLQSNTLEKWLSRVEAINNRAKYLTEKNVGMIHLTKNSIDVYLYSKGKFVTSNYLPSGYEQLEDMATSSNIQNLSAIASGEVDERMVKHALDSWLGDARSHILNTENFFMGSTQGEMIDAFYVYGNEDICWQLAAILRRDMNREIESIDSADCEHVTWDASLDFASDYIPATAMLIRRA